MNVSLPDAMKTWVEAQTEGGRYANASDYVRDLIRHDRERREAIAELQALMDEGIARGEAKPWNIEEFLAEMRTKHGIQSGPQDSFEGSE